MNPSMLAHESARYEQREKLRVAERDASRRISRRDTRHARAVRRAAGDALIGIGLWLGGAGRSLVDEVPSRAKDDLGIGGSARAAY